ncbi:MAG: hypothetical protein GY817_00770 [bacterium]|nr:hypothetical protein [bacterium]
MAIKFDYKNNKGIDLKGVYGRVDSVQFVNNGDIMVRGFIYATETIRKRDLSLSIDSFNISIPATEEVYEGLLDNSEKTNVVDRLYDYLMSLTDFFVNAEMI